MVLSMIRESSFILCRSIGIAIPVGVQSVPPKYRWASGPSRKPDGVVHPLPPPV